MTHRIRFGCWAGLIAAAWGGGCGTLPALRPAKPTPHATASLLDSGPAPRVSTKQAADVQFAIGRTNEENDQLDNAEAAYRSALSKAPKRGDIEARLAIVLDRKGKLAEADQHFTKALKLDPKNPDLLCDRGYSYYLRGQNTDAEKSLRGAIALAPHHPRSHTNLGLVHAAQGNPDAALADFTHAGADAADSRANLALTLALGGKMEAARDQYAQALKAKPTSVAAAQGLHLAATVLKASTSKPTNLPRLPNEPTTAIASTGPRIDPAVVPTSFSR